MTAAYLLLLLQQQIANGIPPRKFNFDQSKMCRHLHVPTKGPGSNVPDDERKNFCQSEMQGRN